MTKSLDRASVLLIGGGVLWALAASVGGTDGGDVFYLAESIWLLAQLALLAGTVELWRADLHSGSRLGTVGFALATLGRVLFVVAEVLALVAGEVQDDLLPVAALPTALGTALAGVAVLRARTLDGAWSLVPLAVGVYPFVLMIPFAAVADEPPVASLIGWGLLFALLGVALRAGRRAPAEQPA
jgi:hypothetical protein